MLQAKSIVPSIALLILTGCAAQVPTGPAIVALPSAGKDLAKFQQEDSVCRGYAQQQLGIAAPSTQAGPVATGAAAGTAVGAAAGALAGAAAGSAGTGAAVGAATGLVAGSAIGAANANASSAELQRRYDIAYAQCMAASGDIVQPVPSAWAYEYYWYPYYGPGYAGTWWWPPTFAFFGEFDDGFHRHFHHFHHFHGGWHGGFHGGGFHHG